ncbi:hypothetical protein BJX63DRAFT_381952 [Aspergillus granulosus]|uniref:Uncharacterized protein n=1 Tax=Aspergillus granulosus TaxID=176169 RepID=A0ABR4HVJ5_9EURO
MSSQAIPSWLVPDIYSFSRLGNSIPPTWHVVFLCSLDDVERAAMMARLCSVDLQWQDRPQVELRRLVEVPWLADWVPPTSIIFKTIRKDPLIFIDAQSRIDHTAIIVWRASKESSLEAARVPISRANILLGVAANGELPSNYPRIRPEPTEELASPATTQPRRGVLPSHLSELRLKPSIVTLISLVHLPATVQEGLQSMIGHPIILHNWPEHQEPCSRAQLFRMFQVLKICHPGNDQAFALFVDEDDEGYHIVRATGSNMPNVSDADASRLELSILPFKQVKDFWHAAWNPESRKPPARMPRGPYRYNPAMWELHAFGGEPIVDPDNIAASLGSDVIFILEAMTPTELRAIRTALFMATDVTYMWVDVADRLASPDMPGLLAYFESSGEFAKHPPPRHFLAVDRRTLSDAMEPVDEREDWEAIILASYEACDVWFGDEMHRSFGHLSTGYGYDRRDLEEAEMAGRGLRDIWGRNLRGRLVRRG